MWQALSTVLPQYQAVDYYSYDLFANEDQGPTEANQLVMQPDSGEAGICTQASLTSSSAPITALAGNLLEKSHCVASKNPCGLLYSPCSSACSGHVVLASFPPTLQPPSSHRAFASAVPCAWDVLPSTLVPWFTPTHLSGLQWNSIHSSIDPNIITECLLMPGKH